MTSPPSTHTVAARAASAVVLALASIALAEGCATGDTGDTGISSASVGAATRTATSRHLAAPHGAARHRSHPERHVAATSLPRPPARAGGLLGPVLRTNGCVARNGYPDPRCTPGAIDPRVTRANVASTICVSGYSERVRPPESVTEPIKYRQMAAYGLLGQRLRNYELDHLVALEIGGAPASVANLWPERHAGADGSYAKDRVEDAAHRAVCDGTITLAAAQRLMARDWKALGARLGVRGGA